MKIDLKEEEFIARRERMVKTWPWAEVSVLSIITVLAIWLFRSNPLMINPYLVFAQLKADSIDAPVLALMTALLPVMVLMCLFLVIAMIIFGHVFTRREKKYQAIIRRNLSDGQPSP